MTAARAVLRLAVLAMASAGGVMAGRRHEQWRPFGTRYFRAHYEVMCHIHDPSRLPLEIPSARPFRIPLHLDGVVAVRPRHRQPPRGRSRREQS